MRAFLFYIDDWLSSKSIEKMDAIEELGFLYLLIRQAADETCTLPDNDDELAILSRTGRQWFKPTKDRDKRIGDMTSGQKIRKEFDPHEGRLFNARMYREWNYQKQYEKKVNEPRRENGQLGGRPRSDDPRCPCGEMTVARAATRKHKCGAVTEPPTEPRQNLDRTWTEPNDVSVSSLVLEVSEKGSVRGNPLIDRFHDLIEAWPNPTGVDEGCRIWIGMVHRGDLTQENMGSIFEGLERWKLSEQWLEKHMVPSVKKWLFEGLWKDFPKPSKRSQEVFD